MKPPLLPATLALLASVVCGPLPARAGDQEEVAALRKALRSDSESVRYHALGRIQALGPKAADAVPDLVALLENKDEQRPEVAVALSKIGKAAVPHLKKILAGADSDEELSHTLTAIGWLGPDASELAPRVLEVLGYSKGELHGKAARALGRLGPAAVPTLIAALNDKNSDIRIEAANALGQVGPEAKAAIEPLKKMLLTAGEKGYVNSAKAAGVALGMIGKAALPAIREVLQTDFSLSCQQALVALVRMGPEGLPTLVEAVGHKHTEVRRLATAVMRFGYISVRDAAAVMALGRAVSDDDQTVREHAAAGLRQLGPFAGPAVPALLAALKHPSDHVRELAGDALKTSRPDPKLLLPALLPLVKDARASVRVLAVSLLREAGPEAVPLLTAALKDPEDKIRLEALRSLREVRGDISPVLPDVAAHLKSGNEALRDAAAEILVWKDDAQAVPHLIATLGHENNAVRRHTLQVLARMGRTANKATPDVLKLARNDDDLRKLALGVVVSFGTDAWPPLLELLGQDKRGVLLEDALAGLSYFHRVAEIKAALPLLTGALKQPSANVRRFAAAALGRGGPAAKEAVLALTALLNDPDPAVRAQVKTALKSIQGK